MSFYTFVLTEMGSLELNGLMFYSRYLWQFVIGSLRF